MELTIHLRTCDDGLPWKMASGKVQDWAWVLYNVDEMLWRQRRVIGRMAPTHGVELEVFGVVSPDMPAYQSPRDIAIWVFLGPRWVFIDYQRET